ncbi:MAG: hypothetical protein ACW990_16760 [Promethearchaeota archaeon]|jgi:hypothetical protein
MDEEFELVKKNLFQTEQENCSCGCKGQENLDFKEIKIKETTPK